MISTSSMSFALDEVVSAVAFETFYDGTFYMPFFFTVRGTQRRRERSASFGGLGDFEVKTEGAEVADDENVQQYERDFTQVAYGKKVPISREVVDFEEWGVVSDLGEQLGEKARLTMEKGAANLFINSFDSEVCEDAKTICNSAHTNVDGANSQANAGALALTFTNLETTRLAMRKFTNYRGDKDPSYGKLLVVPVDKELAGWEIAKSSGKPDTTNNNANFYNGQFDMVVWDFLTSAYHWWLCDQSKMKRNLLWLQSAALEIFGDGNLFTGVRRIGGYYRAARGCKDWRWVYGQKATA
jgi:hypothetical protein